MSVYIRFVLRWRLPVLLIWLAITTAAGAILGQAVISSSIGRLFFGDAPQYHAYLDRMGDFANDEVVVIGLADVDPLSPETLDRLAEAVGRIERIGQPEIVDADALDWDAEAPSGLVRRVHSVLSADRVMHRDGALVVEPFGDVARRDPDAHAALIEELRTDSLSGGLLVSRDGRDTAVIVEMEVDPDRPGEDSPAFVEAIVAALIDAGFERDQLHLAGLPPVMAELMRQTQRNLERVLPITAVVLLLTVFLLFRRVWPAAVAGVVATTGVVWTMGLAVLIDPHLSVMHSIAPMVILIVASSDVIHLCSAYLIELHDEDDCRRDKRDAILAASTDVGTACIYTSLTTFIGFFALSFVPTPVFRTLGLVLGAGVGFALLIAVTVVPILFSYMRRPKPWRAGTTSRVQSVLDRVLATISRVSTTRARLVIAGWVIALAGAGWGLSQLTVETAMTRRLADDNPVAIDRDWFAERFASSNQLDVFLTTDAADGIFDPNFVQRLRNYQAEVEAWPGIDTVFSIADVWDRVHAALAPDNASQWPSTREGFAQYTLLFELGGRDTLSRLVDFERRSAVVSIRVHDEGVRGIYRVGERAAAAAIGAFDGKVEAEPTGIAYLIGEWIGEILDGQRRGLVFSFTLIALMMIIGLRSIRVGLWSMLPNALPLIMLGGWIGATQDATDSDTLILAMLAIGIGVDDTIHFLMRLRIETRRTTNRATALDRTFDFAGRAIVMTTVVLTAGFAPFALTEYYSTHIMGTLLPLTLVVALLADLLLVPALAMVGMLSFRPGPHRE